MCVCVCVSLSLALALSLSLSIYLSLALSISLSLQQDGWTRQMGFPVLSVDDSVKEGGKKGRLCVCQHRFLASGIEKEDNMRWTVPVLVSVEVREREREREAHTHTHTYRHACACVHTSGHTCTASWQAA